MTLITEKYFYASFSFDTYTGYQTCMCKRGINQYLIDYSFELTCTVKNLESHTWIGA